jgi:hypothetical protein
VALVSVRVRDTPSGRGVVTQMASDSHNPPDARVRELEAENERLRDPGAEWLEPWCDEHPDGDGQRCVACIGASHDAWMHRAKAAEREVERLREALKEVTNWAEAARGHYGIEECSGPGQGRTEWDEVQDGLRASALFAREALEAGER